jgi:phage major head subunit gpT-like protein
MNITHATLDALRTTVDTKWSGAYENTETWADQLATTVPSSTRKNTYGWAAMSVALREWDGPRVVQNLIEHEYEIANKLYEATLQVTRVQIEDDNLGIFTNVQIPGLAQATKKHPDILLAALIKAGGSTDCFDGEAFFSSAHPTYDAAGDTYDNDFEQALDMDGVAAVWAAMAAYKGENGQPLAIRPDTLIVPPQLYRAALVVNGSATGALPGAGAGDASATVDNPMRGWFKKILMLPELADEPTKWYMADLSKAVRPLIYQLRDAAQLVSRMNLEDPKVFDEDKFTWGVRIRDSVGYGLPFLMARSTQP